MKIYNERQLVFLKSSFFHIENEMLMIDFLIYENKLIMISGSFHDDKKSPNLLLSFDPEPVTEFYFNP